MNAVHQRFFLAALLFFIVFLIAVGGWKIYHTQQNLLFQKKSPEQFSLIAQKKVKGFFSEASLQQPIKSDFIKLQKASLVSLPLDQPSVEELCEFPGARVVEAVEVPGPDVNQTTRVRILQTHFKYPAIRTEEIIDTETGSIVAREEMIADHLLVSLGEEEDPQDFLKKFGSSATGIIRVTPDAPLYRLKLSSSSLSSLPSASDKIENMQLHGSPDFMNYPCSDINESFVDLDSISTPDDPNFSQQWGLSKINAPDAWKIRTSAASIIVAVIDSGIRYTHQDLAGNMWHDPAIANQIIYGTNAYGTNNDPMDHYGHGTHCAGIIGAVGNNDIGICGVAWKVQLMACKMFEDQSGGPDSDAIPCIDYACDHGAKVLNCSWGDYANDPAHPMVEAAMQRAACKGVIVVAAAGNDYRNIDDNPYYPASFSLDNLVAVAAMTSSNQLVSSWHHYWGSNYGLKRVPIVAPGVGIYSAWCASDSSYHAMDGTSVAAPYVTGALALMMAQFPNYSYQELIHQLLTTTDQLPSLDGMIGYGRLNVAKALVPSVQ